MVNGGDTWIQLVHIFGTLLMVYKDRKILLLFLRCISQNDHIFLHSTRGAKDLVSFFLFFCQFSWYINHLIVFQYSPSISDRDFCSSQVDCDQWHLLTMEGVRYQTTN